MSKKIYYHYNEATQIFERVYLTLKQRIAIFVRQLGVGCLIGVLLFLVVYYVIDFPREKQLKMQNDELRTQYEILSSRMNRSLDVLSDIQQRDDNFYRVMMETDKVPSAIRYSGLANEARYNELRKLSDADLIIGVTKKIDRIERMLYSQIKSFNELTGLASSRKDRLDHIPAIQPISQKDMKQMASGYGYRRDPVYGISKFHEGLDFAANTGTPVYATGNGTVTVAKWNSGYGNCIDISHGFNYVSRYAHLSKMNVKPGQTVKRGDKIGEVGNTGKSTGPHLHYEVRFKDVPQNPINYYFYDITPDQYIKLIQQAENAGHVMD